MGKDKLVPLATVRARIIQSRVASILAQVERTPEPLQADLFQALEQVCEAAQGMIDRRSVSRAKAIAGASRSLGMSGPIKPLRHQGW